MNALKQMLVAAIVLAALAFATQPAFAEEKMASSSSPVVNINTATAEELEALKGIGKAKAQAIVTYREQFGEFESLEELMDVKGIGEATLKENMQWLSLE